VSGAAWAAASGVGFGLFQALNARAMSNLTSAYTATFLQLVAATAVLGGVVSVTGDLGAVTELDPRPFLMFALSGLVRFALGWTTLSLSHSRIGAARTSPLLATGPFFGLARTFPQLSEARIDYCWGGLVDMTLDRMVKAGQHDGVYYSMGYAGHGVQMATYMGRQMAEYMSGVPEANIWRDFTFRRIPGPFGPPWFLPVAGAYYKFKDRVS